MTTWNSLLAERPVVTDGAWGTELQARGLQLGECPDGWNLRYPERVTDVARAYVEAGSRIILTNTFRANRIALADTDLAAKVVEINQRGVELSVLAAGGEALVFASIGPCGKMLAAGEVTEEQLAEAFTEQAMALAAGGAWALLVETMSDLDEAVIAVAAARTTGLPVVASVVFDTGKNKDRTMMGTTPEQAAARLTDAGVSAVGANCGLGIAGYVDICRRLHAATTLPIWIKANAGLPELVDGQAVYRTAAADFAAHVPDVLAAGATFIGGCCGTTPAFIRAVREKVTPCA
jgi:5-methyltetrahydrofolate--homocysteine methyltransferase